MEKITSIAEKNANKFISQNPATEEILTEHDLEDLRSAIDKANLAREIYRDFRRTSIRERAEIINTVGEYLMKRRFELAELITKEMGKPISQSLSEIEKCKFACDYFSKNAEKFLKPEIIETEAGVESYVEFDPVGVILAIMPWNFPFWQVIRCVVPAILVGNVVILKHSPNTLMCAKEIEEIFRRSAPYPILINIFVTEKEVGKIIELVDGVSLTGSTRAGMAVGEIAGRHIKPIVLELGGSDPFLVFEDADLDKAAETAIKSRITNSGQSCIAAKRFIIHHKVYDDFARIVQERIRRLKIGDPMEDPDIGPIARKDLLENAIRIVNESRKAGSNVVGGRRIKDIGFFFEPALIYDADPESPSFREETFAPIMPLIKFKTEEEAIELANKTQYGLGATIFTSKVERAKEIAKYIEAGNVFINQQVRSHPALPFGGVKKSGIGRELSRYGMLEFANIKTISIKL